MEVRDILASPIFLIVALLAIMYIFMIRPQKKKEQERRRMLDNLKKGDRVVTIGGIHGEVAAVKGNQIILRVDREKDVHLKFARGAINRVIIGDEAGDEEQ